MTKRMSIRPFFSLARALYEKQRINYENIMQKNGTTFGDWYNSTFLTVKKCDVVSRDIFAA